VETWKQVWRMGFAPLLSTPGLKALAEALRGDDGRLLQGATTTPPPLQCVQDWPVEAACGVGYCGWQGDHLETVAEVEGYFARVCGKVDAVIGEPASCGHFLDWFDGTSREEMRRELLKEVELVLQQRT
jgi:hypothetical protein